MNKENLANSVRSQTCFKCFHDDSPNNYDIYAIIRSYKDMDWSIEILDSMLETSRPDNLEQVVEYLSSFHKVEQVSLDTFLTEVSKVNKDLGRWEFDTD